LWIIGSLKEENVVSSTDSKCIKNSGIL